jgi:anti-anti-sigma regulatory factor
VKGHPDRPGNAALTPVSAMSLDRLAIAFGEAVEQPDIRGARQMIVAALDAGSSPGLLYTAVVRPALAGLQSAGQSAGGRLAAGVGEAILADLVAHLPRVAPSGTGRAAVLCCPDTGIESLDGTVVADFLERDGWRVHRTTSGLSTGSDDARSPAWGGSVELAVAVIAGPHDALRLAPMCTRLHRLPDPPVTILCDFSGASAHGAPGADDVVGDPQALLRSATRRLPLQGRRRWGVGLRRDGETLVLSPTGTLDVISVKRLADVAVSRAGTFTRLVLDLREIAAVEGPGLRQLIALPDQIGLQGAELTAVVPDAAPAELAEEMLALRRDRRWRVTDRPPEPGRLSPAA